ncbi:MAG: ribosome-binding factor A [Planctomycetes bacterium GWF2_42_9]|nr:MAG: ribosome-binding factor A [Planctomycetes bacterium GWF2_42_9]HAL45887.1 30S ribosome-binding factor RbfA [Phycisphaerales bacterium]
MPNRRQERMARVIKEAVSDIINNHLQDPRIEGFISVTEVKTEPDLKSAEVYISIMAENDIKQRLSYTAIQHAVGRIQALLGDYIESRYCPHLYLHLDERMKKTMETMRLIDEVSKEFKKESDTDSETESEEEEK